MTAAVGVLAAMATLAAAPAANTDLTVKMQKATRSGPGDTLGTVSVTVSEAGTEFKLKLRGLPPGQHGFHVHENAECGPTLMNGVLIPAGAAGRHWDPEQTNRHAGPMGDGHLGDLPVMEVAADGSAIQTLTAPRVKDIALLRGHALVIDSGGDNYSDTPSPQGDGPRLACGPIR
jgi:Cu-Zn family superoxide dismutase